MRVFSSFDTFREWLAIEIEGAIDVDLPDYEEDIFGMLEEAHDVYFQTNTSPSGQTMVPLAESTIAKKGHGIPLIDSEGLWESLISRGSPDAIRRSDGDTITYGTSVEYAGVHQRGSQDGRIPARPFVGWSDQLIDDVTDYIVSDSLESAFQ